MFQRNNDRNHEEELNSSTEFTNPENCTNIETTIELKLKNLIASSINKLRLGKKMDSITVFVARGNFYKYIGRQNSPIFEIDDPISDKKIFLFRVFGGYTDRTCQYIGVYTGKIGGDISFLPGCDVIKIGTFPVEIAETTPVSVSREINESVNMHARIQADKVMQIINAAQVKQKIYDFNFMVNQYEKIEMETSIRLTEVALRCTRQQVKAEVSGILSEWNFFSNEIEKDFIVTIATEDTQVSQACYSIANEDRLISRNALMVSMLAAVRYRKINSAGCLILYPRNSSMDEIVGCAVTCPMMVNRYSKSRPFNVLVSVWVCKELRRNGYGRTLVKKAANAIMGPLIAFLPNDDSDEVFDTLKFFSSCGCKNTIIKTSSVFGGLIESNIGPTMHRILILKDSTQ